MAVDPSRSSRAGRRPHGRPQRVALVARADRRTRKARALPPPCRVGNAACAARAAGGRRRAPARRLGPGRTNRGIPV